MILKRPARPAPMRPDDPPLPITVPAAGASVPDAPAADARAGGLARRFGTPALAVLAATLWLAGLHTVFPAQMGSLGLIARLSPLQLAAYPVLVAAGLAEMAAARPRPRLLAAYTALGVLFVYGLQPASEQEARMSVTWLHVGFAQYIALHGHVLRGYDARFSWPGFFSLIALITRASGSADAAALLQWAPVVFTGLATVGVRALATQLLGTGRAAWIATWLFLLTEWTEQDYFSPQATTYLLMLAGLTVTFRYLTRPGLVISLPADQPGEPGTGPTTRERRGAEAIVLVIALALAPSHQLTPFVFGGLLLIMLCTRRLAVPWLPLLVLVPAVLWFIFGARDFWQGHLSVIFGGIGHLGSSVHQGLGARFVGDAGRTFLLRLRIGLTIWMGALAAGWFVLRRRGIRSWTLPLLAGAPFLLAGLQSYGGEIFLRSYLFALPFAAILGAVAVDALIGTSQRDARSRSPGTRSRPRWLRAVPPVAAFALLTGFGFATVTARGGNDAYTSISRADVAAMSYVYLHVQPGQSVDALLSDVPMSWRDVGTVTQQFFDNCADMADMTQCVLAAHPDYVVITPSQDNHGRIFFGLPPGWTGNVIRQLLATSQYRQVFDEDGSRVLARQHP